MIKPYTARQLLLPISHGEDYLRNYFERVTGKTIFLTITNNSTSMLSVRMSKETVSVRLHRMFLDAEDDVIKEIAKFIKNKKGETPLLRKFIQQNSYRVKRIAPKRATIKTQGKHHDLTEIYALLNDEYFGGTLSCPVTWGTRSHRHTVRKRTLGSYSRHTHTIRINPVLDKKKVPRYFIEFIVYHEMLHAVMNTAEKNGRKLVHSKEFRQRERLFRHHEKASEWEKKWI